MAVYTIQAPDGRKIRIEAPDEATAIRGAEEWTVANPVMDDQAFNEMLQGASRASTQFSGRPVTPADQQAPSQGSFRTGAMEGMTGNFLDEISAGMMTPIEMGIDAFQGKPFDIGRSYQQAYDRNRATTQQERVADPLAFGAGGLTGALVTGGQMAKGGATLMAGAKPTIGSMAGRGAAEGALYGAVYGAGEGEGLQDRAGRAAVGAGLGGALGGVTGAIGGAIAGRSVPKKAPTPELDDLYRAKDQAYQTVDSLGAKYSQQGIDDLVNDIYRRVGQANIDPTPDGAHKAAIRMLERLNERGPMSLTQLDQLRQVIRRDVIQSGTKGDAFFGDLMIDAIDEFIEKAGPGQISGVTGKTADFAITTARQTNRTLKAAETLQDVFESALRRAQASGSGGNLDNVLRQSLNRILDSQKLSMSFTKEQLDLMRQVVAGSGKGQNILRLLGKLSPSGNGLMAMLGIGGTVMNPANAAIPLVGMAAKKASDNMTRKGVEAVTNAVRTGASPMPLPTGGPAQSLLGGSMPAQGLIAPMLPQVPSLMTNRQR